MKLFPVRFSYHALSNNYHGKSEATLKWTARLVRMGSWDHYWCLYLYRGTGACCAIGARFPSWKSAQFGAKQKDSPQ